MSLNLFEDPALQLRISLSRVALGEILGIDVLHTGRCIMNVGESLV